MLSYLFYSGNKAEFASIDLSEIWNHRKSEIDMKYPRSTFERERFVKEVYR